MDNSKNIKLTFYVVSGLLLGAPFIWKLIKLIPDFLRVIPNAVEILAACGYTLLVIASLIVAYKLREPLWIRIVGIYSSVSLGACVLMLITQAISSSGEIFKLLFELVCAPFYGIDSPFTVLLIMLILCITSYAFLNRIPAKAFDGNTQQ